MSPAPLRPSFRFPCKAAVAASSKTLANGSHHAKPVQKCAGKGVSLAGTHATLRADKL